MGSIYEASMGELCKHPGDKNKYRMLDIADGISTVLVSSPGMRASAASLLFNTGWLDDPNGCNGLAHLTEHCVAKYIDGQLVGTDSSDELESFSQYTSRHGGDLHGEVSGEYSVYSFHTASEAFEPALKTFGNAIFHAPSIEPEILGHEILSLNAEFQKNRQLDAECLRSLNTYLSQSRSRSFRRFTDGDYLSLTDHFSGRRQDTCPSHPFHPTDRDLWDSVRARMTEWWSSFYPSSKKYLIVVGPGSIAELAALVNRSFVANRTPSCQLITMTVTVPQLRSPWEVESEQRTVIHIEIPHAPLGLHLWWIVPFTGLSFDYVVVSVFSHILADSSHDSLCSVLREQGWLNKLLVETAPGDARDGYHYLHVTVVLTNSGRDNWHSVLRMMHAYIALICANGIDPQIINDVLSIAQNRSFYQQLHPMEFATDLAKRLLVTQPKDAVLTAHWHCPDFSLEKFLAWVSQYIRTTHARIMLTTSAPSENAPEEGWQILPKYGIKYLVASLDDPVRGPLRATETDYSTRLRLPQPNKFVSQDPKALTDPGSDKQLGRVFLPGFFLVHCKNRDFADLRVCATLVIDSGLMQSLRGNLCLQLHTNIVWERLKNTFHMASAAGVWCQLYLDVEGVVVRFIAYPDKVLELLRVVWDALFDASYEIGEDMFTSCQQLYIRHYGSQLLSLFGALNMDNHASHRSRLRALLCKRDFSPEQKVEGLKDLDLDAVKTSVKRLCSGDVNVRCGLYGNINSAIVDAVVNLSSPVPKASPIFDEWIDLPAANIILEIAEKRPNNVLNEILYCVCLGKHALSTLPLGSVMTRLMKTADAILREFDIGHEIRISLLVGGGYLWLTVFAGTLRDTAYAERAIDRFVLRLQATYEAMHPAEYAMRVEANDDATGFDSPISFDFEDEQVRQHVMYGAGPDIERGTPSGPLNVDVSLAEIVACYRDVLSPASLARRKLSLRLSSAPRMLSIPARRMVLRELSACGVLSAAVTDILEGYTTTSMIDIIERIQAEVSQSTPVVDVKEIVRRAAERYPIEDPATGSASEELAVLPAAPLIFVESIEELRMEVARRAEEVRAVEPKYKKKSCHYPVL